MARSTRRAVPLVLAALSWAVPASAQVALRANEEIDPGGLSGASDAPRPASDEQHARGEYMGVHPGGPEKPPVPATPNTTPAIVTWPGFTMRPDGSSRVFLQTTTAVTVTPSQKGNILTLDLGGARVNAETNQFALYTKFFNTPVVRAQVKRGKNAVLEIELRAAVQPIISTEQAKSGFHFIYIDFPAGNYLTSSTTVAAATAPGAPAPAASSKAVEPPAPAHLDDAPPAPPEPRRARAKLSTEMDGELPPGMGAPKAKAGGKAKAGIKL